MRRVVEILGGLNPAQRQAAEAVRGPVADSSLGPARARPPRSPTASPTRWRAGPSSSGAILAVTFTEKAAGELKARLGRIVGGRRRRGADVSRLGAAASSSGLWQATGACCPSTCLNSGPPTCSTTIGQRAPAARSTPAPRLSSRARSSGRAEPAVPLSADLARSSADARRRWPPGALPQVYDGYVDALRQVQRPDFEAHARGARRTVRRRSPVAVRALSRASTPSPSTSTRTRTRSAGAGSGALASRGRRDLRRRRRLPDDLHVHGGLAEHLLTFPDRYPDATVVRLVENYRSSPRCSRSRTRSRAPGRVREDAPPGDPRRRSEPHRPCAPRHRCRGRVRARRDRERAARRGGPCEGMPVLYRINAARRPTRRRSRRRTSRTRCATGRSCGVRDRDGVVAGFGGQPRLAVVAGTVDRGPRTRSATTTARRDARRRRGRGDPPGRPRPAARALAVEFSGGGRRCPVDGFLAELGHRFAPSAPAGASACSPTIVPRGSRLRRGVPAAVARQ